jgi:hypothetical protein
MKVTVRADLGGDYINFGSKEETLGDNWNTLDYSTLTTYTQNALADVVKEYEDLALTIKFYVRSWTNPSGWVISYTAPGQSYSQLTQHKEVVGNLTYGLYLVYDAPQEPMEHPYKRVLDTACNWVNGAVSSGTVVLQKMRAGVWGSGLKYDGAQRWYSDGPQKEYFNIAKFFTDVDTNGGSWSGVRVECLDCAHMLTIWSRALGASPSYSTKKPTTNNHIANKIYINNVDPIGTTASGRTFWTWHAYTVYSDTIWDVTAQFDMDANPWADGHADFQAVEGMGLTPYKYRLLFGAWSVSGNKEPFALADGQTLTVQAEAGGVQTVTFNAANFPNIAQATADQVKAEINADTTGMLADVVELGSDKYVRITSNQTECTGRLKVTGGTGNGALGFDIDQHYADGWGDEYGGVPKLGVPP